MKKALALTILNIALILATTFAYAQLIKAEPTTLTDQITVIKDLPVSINVGSVPMAIPKPKVTHKSAPIVKKRVTKVWTCDDIKMYGGRGSSVRICGWRTSF